MFIIWLQQYARSDLLFSCNDRAILARCPKYIQFVFNLIADILIDIYVMVNRPLPSSKNPHFQTEDRCTIFLVKMSFICMRIKNDSISKAETEAWSN